MLYFKWMSVVEYTQDVQFNILWLFGKTCFKVDFLCVVVRMIKKKRLRTLFNKLSQTVLECKSHIT